MQCNLPVIVRSRRSAVGAISCAGLVGSLAFACAPVGVAMPEPDDAGSFSDAEAGNGSRSDAGLGADGGLCSPGDVATYHPVYHAANVQPGACASAFGADQLIIQFYESCFGSGKSTSACELFRSTYPACASCILTPDTAASYGPIIDHGGFVAANVEGCVERQVQLHNWGDAGSQELGCAKSQQALDGCELAACKANCAVQDQASLAEFEACTRMADEAGCSTFASAATCSTDAEAVALPGICTQGNFSNFYYDVVPLFCLGSADWDAGASSDGG